jgi:hypothetical protein
MELNQIRKIILPTSSKVHLHRRMSSTAFPIPGQNAAGTLALYRMLIAIPWGVDYEQIPVNSVLIWWPTMSVTVKCAWMRMVEVIQLLPNSSTTFLPLQIQKTGCISK